MKLSDLSPHLHELAVQSATRYELTDDLTDVQVLEILLRGEGIFGFARTILNFVREIDSVKGAAE